jgi:hypothetical protein
LDGSSPYGTRALSNEIDNLTRTPDGNRNATLYSAARSLGQLVAGGELDEIETVEELTRAALGIGLDPAETRTTIRSGMIAGKRRPRSAPEDRPLTPAPAPFRLPEELDIALRLRPGFGFEWETAKALALLPPELARQDVETNRAYLEGHGVDTDFALTTAYQIRGVAVFRYLNSRSIQDPNAIKAAVRMLLEDVAARV